MIVYLSGSFSQQDYLRGIREEIIKIGVTVLSGWLDERDGEDMSLWEGELNRDLHEIEETDLFIYDAYLKSIGKNFEMGYAYAMYKPVWIVGEITSPFQLVATRRFKSWVAAIDSLRRMVEEADGYKRRRA